MTSYQTTLTYKTLSVLVLLCICGFRAQAQFWEVGGGLGSFLYSGELSSSFNPRYASPSVHGIVKMNLNSASVFKVTAGYGRIIADGNNESNRMVKNFNGSTLNSHIIELTTQYEYNFFDYRKYKSPRRGTPYMSLGVAGFLFQPQPVEPNGNVSSFQLAIPLGVGYKYALTRQWNLGGELSFRKTFTTHLDNSTNFIPKDPKTQQYNQFGDAIQRGYKLFDDWYMFAGVTLTYTFYSVKCPFPEYW